MKESFTIFNTNEKNRYGHRFTVSALEDGMWQAGVFGLPTHLSHDMHRPIGWATPFGLYFEPCVTYSVGRTIIAENDEDSNKIGRSQKNTLLQKYSEAIEPFEKEFINLLGSNYTEDATLHYPSCVACIKQGILFDIFPDIKKLVQNEKAGLVYLNDLFQSFDYLSQGIFKHKESEFVVFANSYFRKSLSRLNNFHFEFLNEIVSLHNLKDVKVRISLDHDMVGYAPSATESFEYEYWWGPKYSDDISNIPAGLTQYGSSDFEKLYCGVVNTEFNWKHDNSKYEFELEEVKNEPAPTLVDKYGCRYVHSIFDKDQEHFDHFDGAIRAYNTDLMVERIESKLTDFGRRSEYTKIFRVDGKLQLKRWKTLVTHYLQGNPQIYEYFGLERPEVQKVIEEAPQSIIQKLVPYSINKGEGVRMLVSYHSQPDPPEYDRYISIFDCLSVGNESHDAIEYDTFELKKALQRIGAELFIPDKLIHIIPEDMYCNIPCIHHSDNNTQRLLDDTIRALKTLFTALTKKKNEKIFSYTLSWNVEDKQTRVSILGHVEDILTWMSTYAAIPTSRTDFKIWLEAQAKYLSQFKTAPKTPELSEIVQYDGVLYIKRRPVNADVDINFEQSPKGLKYEMQVSADQSDLFDALRKKEIVPVGSGIAEEIICSKDGKNYINSQYSTYLDEDVTHEVKEYTPIGMFWSDKPA